MALKNDSFNSPIDLILWFLISLVNTETCVFRIHNWFCDQWRVIPALMYQPYRSHCTKKLLVQLIRTTRRLFNKAHNNSALESADAIIQLKHLLFAKLHVKCCQRRCWIILYEKDGPVRSVGFWRPTIPTSFALMGFFSFSVYQTVFITAITQWKCLTGYSSSL